MKSAAFSIHDEADAQVHGSVRANFRSEYDVMRIHLLLLDDLMKRLRWRFPALIAWTALVGLGEGISIVLLLPLLNRLGVTGVTGQGTATRLIDNSLTFIGANSTIDIFAVFVAVTTIQA